VFPFKLLSGCRQLNPGLPLYRIAGALEPMDGSHAQRDVFVRSLPLACDDPGTRCRTLAQRRRLKQDDAFVALLSAR